MNKKEFIDTLRYRCSSLDPYELEEVISYYEEMIDERLEAGEKEEDIIHSFGNIDSIIQDLYANIPFKKIIQKKYHQNYFKPWMIILAILAIPLIILFLPLLIILTVFFSLSVAFLAIFSVIGLIWYGFALAFAILSFNFIDALLYLGIILIFAGILSYSNEKKYRINKVRFWSKIKQKISGKKRY